MKLGLSSILARIIWLHLLALAVTLAGVLWASYVLLYSTANDLQDRQLRERASAVAGYLKFDQAGWSLQLPPDLNYSYTHGSHSLAVADDQGRTVFSSMPGSAILSEINSAKAEPSFFQRWVGRTHYYVTIVPVQIDGHTALIEVARNVERPGVIFDDVIARFISRIAWIVIPIFAGLLFIDILIVRRALGPIREASDLALSIDPSKIHVRLPTKNLPSEILPLAQAVNQALDRLDRGYQMQREFTADAAHELRTPLTIMKTRLDIVLNSEDARAFHADLDGLTRIVDQLLYLAELDSLEIALINRADLNEVSAEVVGLMAPLALANNKSVALIAAPAPVWAMGNFEMLSRAVRNLVENAIRYTKPGTSVEVEVDPTGIIRVMDRGPGITAHERDFIFQRFWRKDRRDKEHSGLGLSIVDRAVQLHAGSLDVIERSGGGTIFQIGLNTPNP